MKKSILSLFLAFFSAIAGGCFVYNPAADFVKQRYTNTIAYFNTYYNAQRLFLEAEDIVVTAEKEYREMLNQSKPFTIPVTARSKFTSSIEKNSKILSFYPESKWIEDALLMIGKAYYYNEDDVRAQRKFQELSVKNPEGVLAIEGQLWLGRSFLRQKKYDQAIGLLESLHERAASNNPGISGLAAYELGKYYFSQSDHDRSIKYYSLALKSVRDGSLLAFIQFQISLCYEQLKQYAMAEQSYAKVADYSPGYTLLFNASLYRIRSIAEQRRYDEALNLLQDMLSDTKNSEFYGSIHYEIANILMADGQAQEAIQKYIYVDTAFARTDAAARSYFKLGNYFESVEPNYDSARTYFNRARSEFPASAITTEAIFKADNYNKYDNLRKDLTRFDSLLTHIKYQKVIDDSLAALVVDTVLVNDTLLTVQQTKKATSPGKSGQTKLDSIPPVDSTKIKARLAKESAHLLMVDSLNRSIVRTKFEFGGLFFVELQLADSALYWFNDVVKNNPSGEFAPRALYTIAEIFRTVKPQPQNIRDSLHQRIIALHPTSPYAQESRKILGIKLLEAKKDSAMELFERGEELSDQKKYDSAILVFRDVHKKYSASPFSAKALFAIGWHYENSMKKNDSALAVYSRLIAQYPGTSYAAAVRSKVTEFENEMKRLENEKQQLIEEKKQKELLEKENIELKEKGLHQQDAQQQTPPDSLIQPQNKE